MARIDFDIEKAKNGAKVVTRQGIEVRILCYDALGKTPIVALVKDSVRSVENVYTYYENGKRFIGSETNNDLFIEVPERWAIVVRDTRGVEFVNAYEIFYDTEHLNRVFKTVPYTNKRIVKLIEA